MKTEMVTEISYRICIYGNVLPAYALNRYLRDTYKDEECAIKSTIAKISKRK